MHTLGRSLRLIWRFRSLIVRHVLYSLIWFPVYPESDAAVRVTINERVLNVCTPNMQCMPARWTWWQSMQNVYKSVENILIPWIPYLERFRGLCFRENANSAGNILYLWGDGVQKCWDESTSLFLCNIRMTFRFGTVSVSEKEMQIDW